MTLFSLPDKVISLTLSCLAFGPFKYYISHLTHIMVNQKLLYRMEGWHVVGTYSTYSTSECPPGERSLSQLSHLRQVGCHSLPREDLRSAADRQSRAVCLMDYRRLTLSLAHKSTFVLLNSQYNGSTTTHYKSSELHIVYP